MASPDQSQVTRYFQVTKTTGTAPACPPPPTCGGNGGSTGWGFWGNNGNGNSGGGCATTPSDAHGDLFAAGAALAALAIARRRRARH
jgi:MYXO-CTERM domain-containing protein